MFVSDLLHKFDPTAMQVMQVMPMANSALARLRLIILVGTNDDNEN